MHNPSWFSVERSHSPVATCLPTCPSCAQIVLSPDEKYLIGQSMDNKIIAYEVGWNNLDDWSSPPIWLIFLGCLRMKELPTISFDEIFVCFFYSRKNMDLGMVWGDLVMLMTEWKGSVFRESISKDRQPHDWNMIFNEMTSYLDLPKFVKLVPVHCHRKKTKPKVANILHFWKIQICS